MILFGLLISSACQQQAPLYKHNFSEEEKLQYAENFLTNLGSYYQGTEDWQFLLKDAKELNPEHPDIYRELGIPPLKRGVISDYYEPYNRAVELAPKTWQGWRGYIYLYFYRDYDRAIQDFDTLDPLTPNFVDYPQSQSIDFMRGIAYLMKNDYESALSYFDKHFEYEDKEVGAKYMENRNFLYKGITHLKKGDVEAANAILDLGLEYNPRSPDLAYWKAKILLTEGKKKEDIRPFVELVKTNFNSRNSRSYTEQFFQLYQSDVDDLDKALEFLN